MDRATGRVEERRDRGRSPGVDPAPDRAEGTKDRSFEDVLLPAIPAAITAVLLEWIKMLNGPGKIAAGAGLGFLLWWLVRRRRGERVRVPAALRRQWRYALLSLAIVSVLALGVTAAWLNRPTPTTAVLAVFALAVLNGVALSGRRLPGAAAAAVSGGLLGLCLAIALPL